MKLRIARKVLDRKYGRVGKYDPKAGHSRKTTKSARNRVLTAISRFKGPGKAGWGKDSLV